jgi:hypothetical protein
MASKQLRITNICTRMRALRAKRNEPRGDFRVRTGRIRDKGAGRRSKLFIGRVLASTQKAGGLSCRMGFRSTFGGRLPGQPIAHSRSRGVVVKARVVRHKTGSAPLPAHLRYLRREGVTKEGEPARMFDGTGNESDLRAFAERCADDRHHFRFIISPDDALEMTDLRAFATDLMSEMERDLGTKLVWTAGSSRRDRIRTGL